MIDRCLSNRAVRSGVAGSVLLLLAACGSAAGTQHLTAFRAPAKPAPITINKTALLDPAQKYYGIFSPNAPGDMSGINRIATETGKQPNLDLYFQAWDSGAASGTPNFSVKNAENDCAAGLLPMLTWESWDTKVQGVNRGTPGVAWAQPAFAPAKITAGDYDAYITATAKLIASLPCPIALRFDQEVNGYWYPWGETTTGMPGTPATRASDYIAMWRHVWQIFQDQGATNVLWVWSPNFQSAKHTGYPDLSASYPGDAYVDWVGIDGYYYNNPTQTFGGLFDSTIKQLKTAAPNKPWLISETGVGSGPNKPAQITNLLKAVLARSRFNGMVYFDQYKPYDRSDWRFDAPNDTADLNAFSTGINKSGYAAGVPGSFSP
jgi:mannan endo-1,4-beta-mannosidase